jgi:hypothetical protein
LDRETGKITLRRLTFRLDCATQIYPAIVESKIRGDAVQRGVPRHLKKFAMTRKVGRS